VNPLGSPTSCSTASIGTVLCGLFWIVVLQSFGDRVEVFAVLVPLYPSLGRIQPLSGIKLVIRCVQQVILVLLIYCREDWATLVSIHIGSLSVLFTLPIVDSGL